MSNANLTKFTNLMDIWKFGSTFEKNFLVNTLTFSNDTRSVANYVKFMKNPGIDKVLTYSQSPNPQHQISTNNPVTDSTTTPPNTTLSPTSPTQFHILSTHEQIVWDFGISVNDNLQQNKLFKTNRLVATTKDTNTHT